MPSLIVDQQPIPTSIRTRPVQPTIKLILAGEAMVIALFDSSGLAVALEEAGPNGEEVDTVARERLLMVVVFSGVVVGAIVMPDFR